MGSYPLRRINTKLTQDKCHDMRMYLGSNLLSEAKQYIIIAFFGTC